MRGNDKIAEEIWREGKLRLRGGKTRVEGVRGAGEEGGAGGGGRREGASHRVDLLSNLLHFSFYINLPLLKQNIPPWQEFCWLENIKRSLTLLKTNLVVLPRNDHSPRDHQSMENITECEVDNVVRPEDCGRGQGGGVDGVDDEEEEGEAEGRLGH